MVKYFTRKALKKKFKSLKKAAYVFKHKMKLKCPHWRFMTYLYVSQVLTGDKTGLKLKEVERSGFRKIKRVTKKIIFKWIQDNNKDLFK